MKKPAEAGFFTMAEDGLATPLCAGGRLKVTRRFGAVTVGLTFGCDDGNAWTTINLILSDLDVDRSLTLTWPEAFFNAAEHLSFRFDSAPVTQVSLHGTLPLVPLAFGGVALLAAAGPDWVLSVSQCLSTSAGWPH